MSWMPWASRNTSDLPSGEEIGRAGALDPFAGGLTRITKGASDVASSSGRPFATLVSLNKIPDGDRTPRETPTPASRVLSLPPRCDQDGAPTVALSNGAGSTLPLGGLDRPL